MNAREDEKRWQEVGKWAAEIDTTENTVIGYWGHGYYPGNGCPH